MTVVQVITIVTIWLALSDGGYHYRATIVLELEVEVATMKLPLSDGCYHYRDYRACAE